MYASSNATLIMRNIPENIKNNSMCATCFIDDTTNINTKAIKMSFTIRNGAKWHDTPKSEGHNLVFLVKMQEKCTTPWSQSLILFVYIRTIVSDVLKAESVYIAEHFCTDKNLVEDGTMLVKNSKVRTVFFCKWICLIVQNFMQMWKEN